MPVDNVSTDPAAPNSLSAVSTQFASANTHAGGASASHVTHSADVASSTAGPTPPDQPVTIPSTPPRLEVTMFHDEHGAPYLVDSNGNPVIVYSPAPSSGSMPGVPIHHSTLFNVRRTSSTTASALSDSSRASQTRPEEEDEEGLLPELDLNIDPDVLTSENISQLNAIRAHIGTANTRLAVTTATLVEHQAATESMHDAIDALCRETVSRVDSMRNELNSQRSRLNRVLDDNYRTLKDNGASTAQVNDLLEAMNRNGGAHRRPREDPHINESISTAIRVPIPGPVRELANAVVPPRRSDESIEDFDKHAALTLRNKERAHNAFPLPAVPEASQRDERDTENRTQQHTLLNSQYPITASSGVRHGGLRPPHFRDVQRAQFAEEQSSISTHGRHTGLDQPVSGYHSGIGLGGRDVVSEFANDMSELIRLTIEHRIGERLILPPGVRTARTDNPVHYQGQDDQELFMSRLEKFLGWIHINCWGGPDMNTYQVGLIHGYLEGDAHQWYITEIDNPRIAGKANLDFADIICALHHQFVKSSSAQRATRAFQDVAWNDEKGPEILMSLLIKKGNAMVEMPSDFVIKDKFLKALPTSIQRELKVRRGMTAEFTPLETLRSHARQVWETTHGFDEEAKKPTATHRDNRAATVTKSPAATFHTRAGAAAKSNSPQYNRTERIERTERAESRPPKAETKGCFACGGTDHFAKDKRCPRYNEQALYRDRPRVAAQRVVESYSYSDEDSEESSPENEDALLSAEEENISPDLDDLLAESEEMRLTAMRGQSYVRYYSMRVVTEEEEEATPTLSPLEELGVPFGNYNPGPVCVVCERCAMLVRQVAATPENGLIVDRTYTVCEHLARIGLDPVQVELPLSPRLAMISLPVEEPELNDSGDDLDSSGDPILPEGVLINIYNPPWRDFTSAEEEVHAHGQHRQRAGFPPLTALEFDVNIRWVRQHRAYVDEDLDAERGAEEERASMDERLCENPRWGFIHRAQHITAEQRDARQEEARIAIQGLDIELYMEPAQIALQAQLGNRAELHNTDMLWRAQMAQAVTVRRLIRANTARLNVIALEDDTSTMPQAEEVWDRLRAMNVSAAARLSYMMAELQQEITLLDERCTSLRQGLAAPRAHPRLILGHEHEPIRRMTIRSRWLPAPPPTGAAPVLAEEEAEYWEVCPYHQTKKCKMASLHWMSQEQAQRP
ncbi:hypothetical protein C8R43DRAFT_946006 [Mycena crocata]|nr:hypothetical protein C8R43DRAFT_946006 [Mycena crocata]